MPVLARGSPPFSRVTASLFAPVPDQNIVWPFQMAWTAALVFGITQLLLADHDGPLDRRDWIAPLLAGFLLGLLCSGVAVTMTDRRRSGDALIRRGWRIAVFQTAPLGVVYAVWWAIVGRSGYTGTGFPAIGRLARYVDVGIGATFSAIGQLPGVGGRTRSAPRGGPGARLGSSPTAASRSGGRRQPGAMLVRERPRTFSSPGSDERTPSAGASRCLFQAPAAPSPRITTWPPALDAPGPGRSRRRPRPPLAPARTCRPGAARDRAYRAISEELADRPHGLSASGRKPPGGSSLSLPRPAGRPRGARSGRRLPGVPFFPPWITIGWLLDGSVWRPAGSRIPAASTAPMRPPGRSAWPSISLVRRRTRPAESLTEPAVLLLDKGRSIGIDGRRRPGRLRAWTPGPRGHARSCSIPLDGTHAGGAGRAPDLACVVQ